MVKQFHGGKLAWVQKIRINNLKSSKVTKEVKQLCIIAPTLFSIMFEAMLMDTYKDTGVGINVCQMASSSIKGDFRQETYTLKPYEHFVCWWLLSQCQLWMFSAEYHWFCSAAHNNHDLSISTKETGENGEIITQSDCWNWAQWAKYF